MSAKIISLKLVTMAHRRKSWIIIAALSLVSIGAFGQFAASKNGGKPKFPRWASDKGYWVIESNINCCRKRNLSALTVLSLCHWVK